MRVETSRQARCAPPGRVAAGPPRVILRRMPGPSPTSAATPTRATRKSALDRDPALPRWAAPAFVAAALVAALLYLPSLGNGFVSWDDPENFLKNPWYRGLGLAQLRWMFSHFWMGHYQPLTWVTLGFDYLAWGLNPRGYHLTSLLIHAASTAVFGLVAARLYRLGRGAGGGALPAEAPSGSAPAADEARQAVFFGVVAALLWGLHPLRVEAVSWATERREVLCGLFTLLALENAVRGGSSLGRHLLALAALLSKATALTLPALFVLIDLYREGGLAPGRFGGVLARSLRRHALLLAAAVGFTVAAFGAQEAAATRISWAWLPLPGRLTTWFHQIGFYVQKSLWPAALAPLYEGPQDWVVGAPGVVGRMNPVGALVPRAVATACATLVALGLAWRVRARRPAPLLLLLAYLGMTIPTGGFGQSGPQVAADRYTYQAGWALTLLATGGLALLWRGRGGRAGARVVVMGLVAVALAGAAAVTVRQQAIWRDSWALWRHTLRHYPDTARANFNLGLLYTEQVPPDDAHAEPLLRAAVRKISGFSDCLDALAEVLTRQGKREEALRCYEQALRGTPGHANTLYRLPNLLWGMGRKDEALRYSREFVTAAPESPVARWKLARALAALGQGREAVATYEAGLARFPDNPSLLTDYAWLLATHPDSTLRDGRRALELARRNVALHPPELRMNFSLVAALAEVGDFDAAAAEVERLLAASPAGARPALQNFLEQMKRREPVRAAPPELP